MLETVMAYCNNWFCASVVSGTFTVKDGEIASFDCLPGQYIRIIGSVFSDGLHQWPVSDREILPDETFTGEIWRLAVPKAFIQLCGEIEKWCETNGNVAGAYTSESFGGYSCSRASNGDGDLVSWQDAFKQRLKPRRKLP